MTIQEYNLHADGKWETMNFLGVALYVTAKSLHLRVQILTYFHLCIMFLKLHISLIVEMYS